VAIPISVMPALRTRSITLINCCSLVPLSPATITFVVWSDFTSRQILHQLELIKLILINRIHGNGLNADTTFDQSRSSAAAAKRLTPAGV
jgi:hypothetical protein